MAFLLFKFCVASLAFADMSPRVLIGATITLSSGAVGFSGGEQVELPARSLSGYVWREKRDRALDFSKPFSIEKLASSRLLPEISFTLADDIFRVTKPRRLIVMTGKKSIVIRLADIVAIEPFHGMLDGYQLAAGEVIMASPDHAALLRRRAPAFSCVLSQGENWEEVLVSYDVKVVAPALREFCPTEPRTSPRPAQAKVDTLLQNRKLMVLTQHWD